MTEKGSSSIVQTVSVLEFYRFSAVYDHSVNARDLLRYATKSVETFPDLSLFP